MGCRAGSRRIPRPVAPLVEAAADRSRRWAAAEAAAVEAAVVADEAVVVAVAVVAAGVVAAEAAVASRIRFRGAARRVHERDNTAVFHQERLS